MISHALKSDDSNRFQAELSFLVRGLWIVSADIVFNEGFESELQVTFTNDRRTRVIDLAEDGAWLCPGFLRFFENGDVTFSLTFLGETSGSGAKEFVIEIWNLAHLGFSPDLKGCCNPEYAAGLSRAMEELCKIDCTSDIDFKYYYNILLWMM